MYIETVPNRNSPPAILLREGWREGRKTRKRTLANLSDWPQPQIETLRRVLRGEALVSPKDLLNTVHTSPHGHVEAILAMIRRLDLDTLISSKRCRERDSGRGHDRPAADLALLQIGDHPGVEHHHLGGRVGGTGGQRR